MKKDTREKAIRKNNEALGWTGTNKSARARNVRMQVGAAGKLDYGELERGAILDQREDDCSGPIGRAE